MSKSDAWGTGWMVVAMVLFAALVIVGALAWSKPWDGWSAVSALGGWAAALGTSGAVIVALRLAKREESWRAEEHRALVAQSILQILTHRDSLRSLAPFLKGRIAVIEERDGLTGFSPEVQVQIAAQVASECERLVNTISMFDIREWARAAPFAAENAGLALNSLRAACQLLAACRRVTPSTHAIFKHAVNEMSLAAYHLTEAQKWVDQIFAEAPPPRTA